MRRGILFRLVGRPCSSQGQKWGTITQRLRKVAPFSSPSFSPHSFPFSLYCLEPPSTYVHTQCFTRCRVDITTQVSTPCTWYFPPKKKRSSNRNRFAAKKKSDELNWFFYSHDFLLLLVFQLGNVEKGGKRPTSQSVSLLRQKSLVLSTALVKQESEGPPVQDAMVFVFYILSLLCSFTSLSVSKNQCSTKQLRVEAVSFPFFGLWPQSGKLLCSRARVCFCMSSTLSCTLKHLSTDRWGEREEGGREPTNVVVVTKEEEEERGGERKYVTGCGGLQANHCGLWRERLLIGHQISPLLYLLLFLSGLRLKMQKGNWILGKKGCISPNGNWFVVLSASIFIAGASVHSAELNPGIDTCTREGDMNVCKRANHCCTHTISLSLSAAAFPIYPQLAAALLPPFLFCVHLATR